MPICALLALAAVGEGLGEWYRHSYLPIHRGSVAGLEPEYACTWAVTAALRPGQGHKPAD